MTDQTTLHLDDYEQNIERHLDTHGYQSVANFEQLKGQFEQSAREHNQKKAVNFKTPVGEIEMFKRRVKIKTGLQYQTFLNMMIHKYNRGELDTVL